VHWMDFPYTEDKAHYFVFNKNTFSQSAVAQMNK
jgi:hypothetical protein